jgi:hypothetical protein
MTSNQSTFCTRGHRQGERSEATVRNSPTCFQGSKLSPHQLYNTNRPLLVSELHRSPLPSQYQNDLEKSPLQGKRGVPHNKPHWLRELYKAQNKGHHLH